MNNNNNPWGNGNNNNYNQRYDNQVFQNQNQSVIATNKILRNTYILLTLTILFSALTASYAVFSNVAPMNPIITLVLYFVLLFAIQATKNSPIGLVLTFALTGFLGYTIGPILTMYLTAFSNGAELIMLSLGMTALIFFGLSVFALNPKRNLSNWGSFLGIGCIVALVAIVANLFLQIPALSLTISIVIGLISAGLIMYQTNMIINGGEDNYISATITLYVSILNLFLIILQFLGMFMGNRE